MKLRIGIACIVASLALAVVAIVSMDWAPLAAMLGLALAFLGIGLVAEATDPRRKPNPRTAHPWAVPSETTVQQTWQAVRDLYDREVVGDG